MRNIIILFLFLKVSFAYGQGLNHAWLLGNQWLSSVPKARIMFDTSNYTLTQEYRKMPFYDTEATICNDTGKFLMSSNGVWIANANNDTLLNGAGLNPNSFTNSYPHGLLLANANIFLPFPGDSNKIILFHETGNFNIYDYSSTEVFYSVIDMTLDSGLGGVISKNNTVFSDTLNWGMAACKHANGRDWWIVAQKDSSDIIFEFLFTPSGVSNVTFQHLNVPLAKGNVTQLTFSQDGTKFSYTTYDQVTLNSSVLLFNFDRCTGLFSSPHVIPVTLNTYLWGLAFSPNGQFVYTTSGGYVFQVNTSTFSVDTVATYDGFYYPIPGAQTTFDLMYLAANGKIYIQTPGSAQHIHEMNYPDSADTACDIQQHAIFLNVWNLRAVPNHPNYYLGCDTTGGCTPCYLAIEELNKHNFHFSLSPNPSNGNFNISYLLPQNKEGKLEILDLTGKILYHEKLPMWSTLQNISSIKLSAGIYNCLISSGNLRVNKKLVILK